MRVIVINLLMVFSLVSLLSSSVKAAEVNNSKGNTEIGLEFTSGDNPIPPKPDIIDKIPPKSNVLLPQTGETILSIVFILIGISVVLLFVGATFIKRVLRSEVVSI